MQSAHKPVLGTIAATLLSFLALSGCSTSTDNSPRGSSGNGGTTGGGSPGAVSGATGNGTGGTAAGSGLGSGSGGARSGAGAASGGSVPGGASDSGAPQPCSTLGGTRACCGTGTQTCGGMEFPTWGPCLDRGGAPLTCNACGPGEFGPGCDAGVKDAGHACGPGEFGPGCDAGMDAGKPPPPDAGHCGTGMECKPGAVRYCDDPSGAEWSQSTCDATGHWAACVATTIPAAAAANGCAQNDFAPEICCGPAKICCQDNPGGPFIDGNSGACAATMCP